MSENATVAREPRKIEPVLFVEAPESDEEIETVAHAFPDTPLLFNAVDGGLTPLLPLDRLRELGYAIVLRPLMTLFAATRAVQAQLASGAESDLSVDSFAEIVGQPSRSAMIPPVTPR